MIMKPSERLSNDVKYPVMLFNFSAGLRLPLAKVHKVGSFVRSKVSCL